MKTMLRWIMTLGLLLGAGYQPAYAQFSANTASVPGATNCPSGETWTKQSTGTYQGLVYQCATPASQSQSSSSSGGSSSSSGSSGSSGSSSGSSGPTYVQVTDAATLVYYSAARYISEPMGGDTMAKPITIYMEIIKAASGSSGGVSLAGYRLCSSIEKTNVTVTGGTYWEDPSDACATTSGSNDVTLRGTSAAPPNPAVYSAVYMTACYTNSGDYNASTKVCTVPITYNGYSNVYEYGSPYGSMLYACPAGTTLDGNDDSDPMGMTCSGTVEEN